MSEDTVWTRIGLEHKRCHQAQNEGGGREGANLWLASLDLFVNSTKVQRRKHQ